MANLTDFAKPKMSFKKGTYAFKKRRKAKKGMPMDKKFKIATAAVEKDSE